MATTIEVDVKQLPEFAAASQQVSDALAAARPIEEVRDEDTLKAAVEALGSASYALKATKDTRLALTKPYRDVATRINTEFNELASPLEGVEDRLKAEVSRYRREQKAKADAERKRQERLARERQEREDARAKKEEREPVKHEPPPVAEPPKVTRGDSGVSVSTRTVWTFEVVDPSALPAEFLTPDTKAIRRAVDSGTREIPGVKIEPEERPVVRT